MTLREQISTQFYQNLSPLSDEEILRLYKKYTCEKRAFCLEEIKPVAENKISTLSSMLSVLGQELVKNLEKIAKQRNLI